MLGRPARFSNGVTISHDIRATNSGNLRAVGRRCLSVAAMLLLSACASPGYHYNAWEFTQTPNDPCWRNELLSPGFVGWLNSTVGHPKGVPARVQRVSAISGFDAVWFASLGLSRSNAELACHATLALTSGATVSGLFFVSDLGSYDNGVSKGLAISWVSDEAITAEMLRQKRLPPGATTYFPSRFVGPPRPN